MKYKEYITYYKNNRETFFVSWKEGEEIQSKFFDSLWEAIYFMQNHPEKYYEKTDSPYMEKEIMNKNSAFHKMNDINRTCNLIAKLVILQQTAVLIKEHALEDVNSELEEFAISIEEECIRRIENIKNKKNKLMETPVKKETGKKFILSEEEMDRHYPNRNKYGCRK